ncbi:MAG: hypothetical protein V1875_05305 [Candidatus Altiarchaeota archaeon]
MRFDDLAMPVLTLANIILWAFLGAYIQHLKLLSLKKRNIPFYFSVAVILYNLLTVGCIGCNYGTVLLSLVLVFAAWIIWADLTMPVLIAHLLVFFMISQLGGFCPCGPMGPTATGFAKLKPQLAGTYVTGHLGTTNFIFTNGAAGTIRVQSVAVEDLVSPVASPCAGANALQSNSADLVGENADSRTVVVPYGENLRISNQGCLSAMETGEVYNARVRITYAIDVNGKRTLATETGTIRGPAE